MHIALLDGCTHYRANEVLKAYKSRTFDMGLIIDIDILGSLRRHEAICLGGHEPHYTGDRSVTQRIDGGGCDRSVPQ
jgi:hypothetical protein